jgi:hypothetical protein
MDREIAANSRFKTSLGHSSHWTTIEEDYLTRRFNASVYKNLEFGIAAIVLHPAGAKMWGFGWWLLQRGVLVFRTLRQGSKEHTLVCSLSAQLKQHLMPQNLYIRIKRHVKRSL